MAAPVLIIPGLGGSGPEHWQSLWQARLPDARRVEQADWDKPDRAGWIAQLDAAVAQSKAPPILVAHSLVLRAGRVLGRAHKRPVHGALLVAPADVDSDTHTPPEAHVFRPVPMTPLPFPTIVPPAATIPMSRSGARWTMAKAWGASWSISARPATSTPAPAMANGRRASSCCSGLQAGKPAYHSA